MSLHSFQLRNQNAQRAGYFFAYADAELEVGGCVDVLEGGGAVEGYAEGAVCECGVLVLGANGRGGGRTRGQGGAYPVSDFGARLRRVSETDLA